MKLSREYATQVCNLFAQLGARGVSVLFTSGDQRRRQELRTFALSRTIKINKCYRPFFMTQKTSGIDANVVRYKYIIARN